MLQSEFFERTKVNLEPQVYIKVETLYNEVKMDKDAFCKEFLKLQKNPLFKEIVEAFYESQQMVYEIARLKNVIQELKVSRDKEVTDVGKQWANRMRVFAQDVILANEAGELRVYDVVKEEYGIGFIIKTKHVEGVSLTEEEISYMVSKL